MTFDYDVVKDFSDRAESVSHKEWESLVAEAELIEDEGTRMLVDEHLALMEPV